MAWILVELLHFKNLSLGLLVIESHVTVLSSCGQEGPIVVVVNRVQLVVGVVLAVSLVKALS